MTIFSRNRLGLALLCLIALTAHRAVADPWPDQLLKFYQMPLNNGLTPYLPVGSYPAPVPAGSGYGSVMSTAIYPGHDEFSTAYAVAYQQDPLAGPVPVAWRGEYMADDFADYAGTPISHVRWWGSYMNQNSTGLQVKRFLISFEHNVPESIDPTGNIIPSHPDVHHPGNLHQIVDLVPGVLPPPPGTFTEKPLITPPGPVAPREPLMEYNAELHLDKWFYEKAASPNVFDDVYWLKIVALVDQQRDGPIQWGWHNRDWSIPNALAAKPGDTPDGAEHIAGYVPGSGPGGLDPVWHFEDNAVTGLIDVTPGMSPYMPQVQQVGFTEQNYLPPWDGPTPIINFSKDLAFELYTRIPEPLSLTMVVVGMAGVLAVARRR